MSARNRHRELRPDFFPVAVDIPARFSDLDTLRHINNVAVAGIFAEGRNDLIRQIFARTERPADLKFIVAQVCISYLGEAHYPATLTIASGVVSIGRSSFRVGQGFFHQGRCTSVAQTVLVATDQNGTLPLPDAVRAVLAGLRLPEGFAASCTPKNAPN